MNQRHLQAVGRWSINRAVCVVLTQIIYCLICDRKIPIHKNRIQHWSMTTFSLIIRMRYSCEYNRLFNRLFIFFLFTFHLTLGDTESFFHCSRRRDRLQSVRSTFYQCYCKAIGFKYKNGAELSSLGSMLGNIAERVGFSQRTQMQALANNCFIRFLVDQFKFTLPHFFYMEFETVVNKNACDIFQTKCLILTKCIQTSFRVNKNDVFIKFVAFPTIFFLFYFLFVYFYCFIFFFIHFHNVYISHVNYHFDVS